MKDVLMKAQALAEAILDSEIYQQMHRLEREMLKNTGAQAAIRQVQACRRHVEEILTQNDLDHEALQRASDALHQAEETVGTIPLIREASEASTRFSDMMENVNQILRLVLSGEPDGGDASPKRGCFGGCGGCGGCCH